MNKKIISHLKCPSCHHALEMFWSDLGATTQCNHCHKIFRIGRKKETIASGHKELHCSYWNQIYQKIKKILGI